MKPNDRSQFDRQLEIVKRMREEDDANGIPNTEMKLRTKYSHYSPCKFGGKKKKNSNSGGQGKAGRRLKRPHVPKNTGH